MQLTQISKDAKATFIAILDLLKTKSTDGDGQHITIDNNKENSGFMPLTVELVGEGIESAWGIGKLYSFAHYYIQEGDSMRDPEIVYFVVDNRTEDAPGNFDMIGVWPQMWQQDGIVGGFKELITIQENKLKSFMPKYQRDAAQFTSTWMKNLKWQQNIVPVKETKSNPIQNAPTKSFQDKFTALREAAKKMGFSTIAEAISAGKENELFNNLPQVN